MTVRPARKPDVPALRRVARRAWSAAHEPIVGREAAESFLDEHYATEQFRSRVEAPETLLYAYVPSDDRSGAGDDPDGDGDPVGYALAVPDDDDPRYHLGQLYVDPDRWGEGIGGRLLDRVERAVRDRGADRIELGVLAANDRAVGFYEAAGFQRTGEQYDDRLDARAYEYERQLG